MRNRLAESGILDAIPDGDAACAATETPKPINPKVSSAIPPRPATESIAAWLDIAIKLCRLNEREADSLREELESHLNDRINDMLITGANEQQASDAPSQSSAMQRSLHNSIEHNETNQPGEKS